MNCVYCGRYCKNNNALKQHTIRCSNNPNKITVKGHRLGKSGENQFTKAKKENRKIIVTDETKNKLSKVWLNKTHSEESKLKISKSMKLAHKESRAHNIGKSRWNNEMSYPEKFFKKAVDNEFDNTDYTMEYNVGLYSIDFAWVNDKLAIEIDGQQHEKLEYKERDIRKDLKLKSEGWKVLRIKWVDMYHNPKKYIKIAKDFIDINAPRDSQGVRPDC